MFEHGVFTIYLVASSFFSFELVSVCVGMCVYLYIIIKHCVNAY